MSLKLNEAFKANTLGFIRQNVMTAVGFAELPSGTPIEFDLCAHVVNSNNAVNTTVARLAKHRAPATSIRAYWVPQGGSCLVSSRSAHYVFTPDFSGCSLLIDQLSADTYRVYHVQGGSRYIDKEYSAQDHGLGLVGAMTWHDHYGARPSPCCFAFMKYEEGRWWIYYQRRRDLGCAFKKEDGTLNVHGLTDRSSRHSLAPVDGNRLPVADLNQDTNPQKSKVSHSVHGGVQSLEVLWPGT